MSGESKIPQTFISHAADVLGETNQGLSGSKIIEHCSAYAVDFNVEIPHPKYPFSSDLGNKRTALKNNLSVFSPEQQYKIIKELCDLDQFKGNATVRDLKIKLVTRYSYLSGSTDQKVNETLVTETKHWLGEYPVSLKSFSEAMAKLDSGIFARNLLDDLRLSLECLLKELLRNDKSLENQMSPLGAYIGERKGSKELNNMFVKLIEYYCKYQNSYVKHDDAVIESEIEIISEMTCSFMKFLIRIK